MGGKTDHIPDDHICHELILEAHHWLGFGKLIGAGLIGAESPDGDDGSPDVPGLQELIERGKRLGVVVAVDEIMADNEAFILRSFEFHERS